MNFLRLHIIIILLISTSLCYSQEKDSLRLRQEFSVGIGAKSLADAMIMVGTFGKHDPGPELHLQYLYNVNKCIGLGALAVFEYSNCNSLATFNAVARFYWFNKRRFAMYSKLGAGICLGIEDEEIIPMINLMPIGIEVGDSKWRFFTEILPLGTIGILNGGIKYSF